MWTPGSMATASGSASTLCMGRFGRNCCQTTFSGTRRGNDTDGSTAASGGGSGGYRLCDPSATRSSSLRRTCGWCLSSILRHIGGSCRYSTETGLRHPIMAQLQIPLGRLPFRFPSCSSLIRCSMSLLRKPSRFVRSRGRRSGSHSCSSFSPGQVVARPLCATTGAHGR